MSAATTTSRNSVGRTPAGIVDRYAASAARTIPVSRTARPLTERNTRRVAVPTSAGRSTSPETCVVPLTSSTSSRRAGERAAVHRGEPVAQRRGDGQRRASVLPSCVEREAHVAPRERHRPDHVENRAPLRARAAQELETRRRVVEEARHAHGRAATSRDRRSSRAPCRRRARTSVPAPSSRRRLELELRHRADRGERLAAKAEASHADEVAAPIESSTWRAARATSTASSRDMPLPSSLMRIVWRPPSSIARSIDVAPASSAFSISSLTTDAGRSTTSPAAIWSATALARTAMRGATRRRSPRKATGARANVEPSVESRGRC